MWQSLVFGNPKREIATPPTEARNDNIMAVCSPTLIATRDAFCPDVAIPVSQWLPASHTSLRGRAFFALTKQSLVPRGSRYGNERPKREIATHHFVTPSIFFSQAQFSYYRHRRALGEETLESRNPFFLRVSFPT